MEFINTSTSTNTNTNELAIDSDIYEPSIGDDGNYIDNIPPSSKFIYGLRCPCGTRKDHVFDSRPGFISHIKSKSHKNWLANLNTNKTNYYSEYEKLKEVVSSQKLIIAKMENELQMKQKTVDYLLQQLVSASASSKHTKNSNNDFESCD
jgi:hypothetical protein